MRVRRVLCLTILGLLAFAADGVGASVKVGVVGPYTGSSAPFGISMREGVQLAVEEINAAGGVRGLGPIELVLEDDEGKPDVAVSAVAKVVQRDRVAAVIGPINSSNCLASMRVTQKERVPQITPVCASPAITAQGNPYIFRTTLSDSRYAASLAEFAVKTARLSRFAILHDADDYGTDGANVFERRLRELGIAPLVREKWNRGDKDFTAQLLKVKEGNADGLLTWGLAAEIALIARQARQLGITARLLGGTGLATPRFLELGGPAVEGTLVTMLFVPDLPDPRAQAFVRRYEARFGRRPDTFAAQAYDSAHLLAGALASGGVNGPKLRDAIAKSQYEGITGPVVFDETGERIRGLLVTVIRSGKFVPWR